MRRLTTVLLLLTVAALPSTAARADTAPEFFQLPAGNPLQGGIAAATDGSIWVGAGPMSRPGLVRLQPALATPGTANGVDAFPTPALSISCCANMVRNLAADPESGRVWFVQSDGIVGHANPAAVTPGTGSGISATLVRTTLTGGGSWSPDLADLAIARGGVVWFTERSTTNVAPYPGARIASIGSDLGGPNELSNIALQGGATSLVSARYDAKPSGIAVDADGRPWFAQSSPGLPGWRIATPRGGGGPDYDEYLVTPCAPASPCSGSHTGTGVTDVAVAPDGSVWFTNELRNELGRLDARAGTFTSYALPAIDGALAGGRPVAISTAPDGTLWLAQYGGVSYPAANAIVKILPDPLAPSATVWRLGRDNNPIAVTADASGNVWFALATNTPPSLIGRLAGVVGAGPGGGPGPGGGGTPGGGTPGGGTPGTIIRPVSTGVARPGAPSTDGDTMSIDQICVGPPEARCSVVYIISAGEYVTGFPGARSDDRDRSRAVLAVASAGTAGPVAASAAAKRGKRRARGRGRARRARVTILGTKTVTLRGGQRARVKVTLNAAGRRLLRRAGRLKLFMTVTERGSDGRGRRVKAVKVTFRRPAARGRARLRR